MSDRSEQLLSYFLSVFPSREGFSAYRSPGFIVHLPVWGLIAAIGFILSFPYPWLRPLIIIYAIAGMYLGRDLAILAHYNPLITLFVFFGSIALIVLAPERILPWVPDLWRILGPWIIAVDLVAAGLFVTLLAISARAMISEMGGDDGADSGPEPPEK